MKTCFFDGLILGGALLFLVGGSASAEPLIPKGKGKGTAPAPVVRLADFQGLSVTNAYRLTRLLTPEHGTPPSPEQVRDWLVLIRENKTDTIPALVNVALSESERTRLRELDEALVKTKDVEPSRVEEAFAFYRSFGGALTQQRYESIWRVAELPSAVQSAAVLARSEGVRIAVAVGNQNFQVSLSTPPSLHTHPAVPSVPTGTALAAHPWLSPALREKYKAVADSVRSDTALTRSNEDLVALGASMARLEGGAQANLVELGRQLISTQMAGCSGGECFMMTNALFGGQPPQEAAIRGYRTLSSAFYDEYYRALTGPDTSPQFAERLQPLRIALYNANQRLIDVTAQYNALRTQGRFAEADRLLPRITTETQARDAAALTLTRETETGTQAERDGMARAIERAEQAGLRAIEPLRDRIYNNELARLAVAEPGTALSERQKKARKLANAAFCKCSRIPGLMRSMMCSLRWPGMGLGNH